MSKTAITNDDDDDDGLKIKNRTERAGRDGACTAVPHLMVMSTVVLFCLMVALPFLFTIEIESQSDSQTGRTQVLLQHYV